MMGGSMIRRAAGKVKDKASIGLARVANATLLSDLDVAVVKATLHDDHPPDDKHVRRILSISSYSRSYVSAAVATVARRLRKTRNWTVALKSLLLLHRLLANGGPAFEREVFFYTRRGRRLLDLSHFRDSSMRHFSAFVRTFALYVDHALDFRLHTRAAAAGKASIREMSDEQIFSRMREMQLLLDRFLVCRPSGEVKNNRVVIFALYPVVRESFQMYYDITDMMAALFDRFMEMGVTDCVTVHRIFTRIAKQLDHLHAFYRWCDSVGICRSSDFPIVEKISLERLQIMDEFIRDKSARQSKSSPVEEIKKLAILPAPPGEVKNLGSNSDNIKRQEEGDDPLINLMDDVDNGGRVRREQEGDNLALVAFDGEPAVPAWEAFTSDWETELVASAISLSSQQNTTLDGGFSMSMLNNMYQQLVPADCMGSGSASCSVTFPTPGSRMPALPAPPGLGEMYGGVGVDPFAMSTSVPPPLYERTAEMERRVEEEKRMWGHHVREGMHGQLTDMDRVQHMHYSGPYFMQGGYPQPGWRTYEQ